MVVLGMLGAIVFGYSLDKTHKYKYVDFLIMQVFPSAKMCAVLISFKDLNVCV